MRWGEYIKRTAVRRVVWVVVGLLVYALFGVGNARALEYEYQTRQEAYAACTSYMSSRLAEYPDFSAVKNCTQGVVGSGPRQGYFCQLKNEQTNQHLGCRSWHGQQNEDIFSFRDDGCPAGSEWREDLGRCFDPSECTARNAEPGFINQGSVSTNYSEGCFDGCQRKMLPGTGGCSTVGGIGGGQKLCFGEFEFSGNQCSAPPPPGNTDTSPAEPKPQECIPIDGQNLCVKGDGQHCYTARSNGNQVCWQPTETGEKYAGDTLQKRNAGTQAIPPANPNLPNGDVLEQSSTPITTTTVDERTGTTTTTTTTNHTTINGTAPGPDQSEPGDGTGSPDGKGDDDKGSVSGGGDCEIPPIVSGGDPIAGAVLEQTWNARCAVEAGNAAKVTGDVADCASPFSVEGDNANAVKLRAMREQICKEGERAENQGIVDGLEAINNAMEGEHSVSDIWGDGSGGDGISTTRYGGGGSCPVLEVNIPALGMTWTPPPFFCNVIAALRLLFITMATIWALRIIGS